MWSYKQNKLVAKLLSITVSLAVTHCPVYIAHGCTISCTSFYLTFTTILLFPLGLSTKDSIHKTYGIRENFIQEHKKNCNIAIKTISQHSQDPDNSTIIHTA